VGLAQSPGHATDGEAKAGGEPGSVTGTADVIGTCFYIHLHNYLR
jgi:hypothetical protein